MNLALRVLCVPSLAATLLTGCSEPSRLGACPKLDAPSTAISALTLTKEDKGGAENLECEWRADPAATVKARIYQPASYREGQSRADSSTEKQWKDHDELHVTHRVDGLGDGGYRFTTISNDLVTVTVKGFHGFRELTLEVSQPYSSDEATAALEKASETLGSSLLVVS